MTTSPSTYTTPKQGKGTTSTPSWRHNWMTSDTCGPTISLLPLRHLQGGDAQVANLRNVIELKHYNTIKMKMLTMRTPTGPKRLYIKLRPNFMSTREDRETSTTKRKLRLPPPLRHLWQVLSRHLRLWTSGIFANKQPKTTLKRSSPSSSPRLPRATTTSTPTSRFLSMGLKNPRSISSGSA